MAYSDDSETEILKETGAERLEVDLLGVTLHFADGHAVLISDAAAQQVGMMIHTENRKALNKAREELRRTKAGFGSP
jgi:hypothetical protein